MITRQISNMLPTTTKIYTDLFDHIELTPIHGKPNVNALVIIFQ